MNLTAKAMGEPGIHDFSKYINFTGMAEGLVGGHLPNAVFYFPILPVNGAAGPLLGCRTRVVLGRH